MKAPNEAIAAKAVRKRRREDPVEARIGKNDGNLAVAEEAADDRSQLLRPGAQDDRDQHGHRCDRVGRSVDLTRDQREVDRREREKEHDVAAVVGHGEPSERNKRDRDHAPDRARAREPSQASERVQQHGHDAVRHLDGGDAAVGDRERVAAAPERLAGMVHPDEVRRTAGAVAGIEPRGHVERGDGSVAGRCGDRDGDPADPADHAVPGEPPNEARDRAAPAAALRGPLEQEQKARGREDDRDGHREAVVDGEHGSVGVVSRPSPAEPQLIARSHERAETSAFQAPWAARRS